MEQSHLHKLLQELSSRLVCPHCNAKIAIHDLELKTTHGNTCLFDAYCHECDSTMSISAIIETQASPRISLNKDSEASYGFNKEPQAVSTDEVLSAKKALKKAQSISSLFNS